MWVGLLKKKGKKKKH